MAIGGIGRGSGYGALRWGSNQFSISPQSAGRPRLLRLTCVPEKYTFCLYSEDNRLTMGGVFLRWQRCFLKVVFDFRELYILHGNDYRFLELTYVLPVFGAHYCHFTNLLSMIVLWPILDFLIQKPYVVGKLHFV